MEDLLALLSVLLLHAVLPALGREGLAEVVVEAAPPWAVSASLSCTSSGTSLDLGWSIFDSVVDPLIEKDW